MLVLSRRPGESVTLFYGDTGGQRIEIVVELVALTTLEPDCIVLGFTAPTAVAIIRTELMERDSVATS